MGKFYTLLFAVAVAVCASSCEHKSTTEEQQVRDAAIKYRDAYVDGFSVFGSQDIATNLAHGTIQSVEALSNGWDVVFGTKTNGKLKYLLHVYVEPDGRLGGIVRDRAK